MLTFGRRCFIYRAILVLCLYASSAGISRAQPAPVIIQPVYVDGLLDSLSVGQAGAGRYRARSAVLEGQRYDHSLVTDVEPGKSGGESSLTLLLGSAFDLLRVTVGRDDNEVAQGPGGAYFEIWGDDQVLFKSSVILSRKRSPRTGGSPLNVRLVPEEVEVPLRAVSVVRLVTRYASDIPQSGRNAGRARGCVWADLRLMPRAEIVSTRSFDPVRDALRAAAARLSAAVVASRAPGPAAEGTAARSPLRVGVAPLHAEGNATDEAAVRAALQDLLSSVRLSGGAVFTVLPRREAGRLIDALPAGGAGDGQDAALAEAGRRAGADVVVTGSVLATKEGRLELRAVDVPTGRPLARAAALLVFPSQAKNN